MHYLQSLQAPWLPSACSVVAAAIRRIDASCIISLEASLGGVFT